jgi:histidinol dehydrogenase
MPVELDSRDPGFADAFDSLVAARRETDEDVGATVREIIAAVRERGADAVAGYTRQFDHIDLDEIGWEVPRGERKAALDGLDPELRKALQCAADRIASFHAAQRPAGYEDAADGVRRGYRWTPVATAGLYVPGGRASYPSSVLMNAIPAKVAGVGRLAMVTPTPDGRLNPLVLAAAEIAGVDEVFRIGGAQAIAALAYGAGPVAPVDVIVGPGNAWVAEAKRQLYGVVGIDMVAGPSEIVVVADADNDPAWIAADLMSQAEHDPTSQSILITDAKALASAVAREAERLLAELGGAAVESWARHGAIIAVADLGEAAALVDRLAPEHLEIATADPQALFDRISHAGSVFLGRHTPEAIGDYVGGPNHVLPTGRRARFASGLSVADFMKRTTYLQCDRAGLAAIGPAAVTLAKAEGLPAHARSVSVRL